VQRAPQSIWLALAGFDVDVTVPFPTPSGLDLVTVSGNVCRVNVPVTVRFAFNVTVQLAPDVLSHPSHRVKADPIAGDAVSVTTVPTG
jgi:hypothetical protein